MPGAGMYGLKSPPPRGRFRAPSYPYPTLCYEPVNLQVRNINTGGGNKGARNLSGGGGAFSPYIPAPGIIIRPCIIYY